MQSPVPLRLHESVESGYRQHLAGPDLVCQKLSHIVFAAALQAIKGAREMMEDYDGIVSHKEPACPLRHHNPTSTILRQTWRGITIHAR